MNWIPNYLVYNICTRENEICPCQYPKYTKDLQDKFKRESEWHWIILNLPEKKSKRGDRAWINSVVEERNKKFIISCLEEISHGDYLVLQLSSGKSLNYQWIINLGSICLRCKCFISSNLLITKDIKRILITQLRKKNIWKKLFHLNVISFVIS